MPTLLIQEKKDLKKGDAKEVIRVSISEAARLFGVNPQTIRRAIRDQDVTYVVVAGRYKINFESLVKWSQRKTTVRNKSNQHGIGQFIDRWKISNTLYLFALSFRLFLYPHLFCHFIYFICALGEKSILIRLKNA